MSPAEAAGKGRPPRRAKGDGSPGAKRGKPRQAKDDAGKLPSKGRVARKRPNPLGRLRRGEAIYLAAAILLFILMFLAWFGVKGTTSAEPLGGLVTSSAGGDAWQALEVIPLFLMLAIVVAVGAALLRVSGSNWKPAIPPGAAVCVLGGLAALLILIRIISPPGPGDVLEGAFETTLKLPVFLALAAALGIAYGGWRAMADEGTSFGDTAKRLESPRRPPRAKAKPAGKSGSAGRPKP
jgi:hypothetical protein